MAGNVVVNHRAVARLADGPASPVGRYVGRLAAEVADRARSAAPSRTGHLRASIHVVPLAGGAWAVVAATDYARIINDRTGFLTDALAQVVAS
jgi:hypothetical protein